MTQEPARRFLIVLAADDPAGFADQKIGLSRIAPADYAFKESGLMSRLPPGSAARPR